MGEHKYNPTAIAAKRGELPPKEPKLSKWQRDALIIAKIREVLGLNTFEVYEGSDDHG